MLFVAVSLVASFANVQPPAFDTDHAEIAAWFAGEGDRYRVGHGPRTILRAGSLHQGVCTSFFLP